MLASIKGIVVKGNRIGNKLGFPTVNLPLSAGNGIKNGVYAARVTTPQGTYDAMASVGTRPSVTDSEERFVEANLFGFDGDLYGQKIEIILEYFIRDEVKFSSLEELKRQIEKDKEYIIKSKQ